MFTYISLFSLFYQTKILNEKDQQKQGKKTIIHQLLKKLHHDLWKSQLKALKEKNSLSHKLHLRTFCQVRSVHMRTEEPNVCHRL